MAFRKILLTVLALMLALGLVSCGGSKYLLKGLTLPPGSVEKDFITSSHGGQQSMLFPTAAGTVKKSVTVAFDCSGGWGAVTSHIDGFMRGLGYKEFMQQADGMTGSIPGAGDMKMSDMMRSYIKMGENYSVALMNASSLSALGGGNAFLPSGIGTAEFIMIVIEVE